MKEEMEPIGEIHEEALERLNRIISSSRFDDVLKRVLVRCLDDEVRIRVRNHLFEKGVLMPDLDDAPELKALHETLYEKR